MQNIVLPFRDSLPAGAQTELRAQVNMNRRVTMLSGTIVGNTRSQSQGVCARVCRNGIHGFSSMADLSEAAAGKVLKQAADNALFMDTHAGRGKQPRPVIEKTFIEPGTKWDDPEQKYYIEFMKALDDHVSKYEGVQSRTLIGIGESREKCIITSDGADAHIAIPRSYVYVVLDGVTKDGSPIEVFDVIGGGFGSFSENYKNPEALFEEADKTYEKLRRKQEGIYAEAGYKTVILSGNLAGMLAHEAVGHTVEADLVMGGSIASTSLGKQVASELVSMTDFAHTAFGKLCPLPVYADDEGTPAVDAPLIKDGILVGYMNNRETAEKYGMKPCGNARAYAYSDEPLIRMRNTFVHPGKDHLEDMIASVEDGYYLTDTNNGQADMTGEFMFGITGGYEIKNGKLGRSLLDTTISGVAFEMLKTVDMVSDVLDSESSGYCGKKQPMPVGLGGPALRCKVMIGGR